MILLQRNFIPHARFSYKYCSERQKYTFISKLLTTMSSKSYNKGSYY